MAQKPKDPSPSQSENQDDEEATSPHVSPRGNTPHRSPSPTQEVNIPTPPPSPKQSPPKPEDVKIPTPPPSPKQTTPKITPPKQPTPTATPKVPVSVVPTSTTETSLPPPPVSSVSISTTPLSTPIITPVTTTTIPEQTARVKVSNTGAPTVPGTPVITIPPLPTQSTGSNATLEGDNDDNRFSCSKTIEKITIDLYQWFNREALSIPNIDMATALAAFKMGLRKESAFYEDLMMTPFKRLDEVKCRALRFIKIEEDKEVQKKSNPSSQYENPNRKAESSAPRSYKSKHYSKPDHHKVNALEDEGEEEEPPK
ncbi:extensin-like [Lactuca sativa]|uniref:extensin-like n=1 Tax=Lactuca sativa TaxID=4236 RepID=UPI000CD9D343|nr:extensin-like [Lactuca sativa]